MVDCNWFHPKEKDDKMINLFARLMEALQFSAGLNQLPVKAKDVLMEIRKEVDLFGYPDVAETEKALRRRLEASG